VENEKIDSVAPEFRLHYNLIWFIASFSVLALNKHFTCYHYDFSLSLSSLVPCAK
jgi:hypothetical protein